MAWRAGMILAEGGSVVADAVFDRQQNRDRIEQAATSQDLPFLGIWLEAATDVLWHRVDRRKGGPSDATVDILSQQLKRDAGEIDWRRLSAWIRPTSLQPFSNCQAAETASASCSADIAG